MSSGQASGSARGVQAVLLMVMWKHRILQILESATGQSLRSASARSFVKSVGWIGVSFVTARAVGMFVPLVVARLLGPKEFGLASLAVTVGQFLSMVMIFGMNNAVVRYAAPLERPRQEIGAASLGVVGATAFALLLLYADGLRRMQDSFGLTSQVVRAGVVVGLLSTLCVFATAVLQGLHRFFARGVAELLTSVGSILGLGVGLLIFGKESRAYVTAVCFGFLLASLYAIERIWRAVGPPQWPAPPLLKRIAAYGLFSCLGNIGFILTFYFQPMIVNKLLSEYEVGLFRVYSTVSITVALVMTVVFNTVVFPKASASTNRAALWRITWRLWAIAAIPLGLAYVVSQLVLLPIAGKQYPVDIALVGLFALVSLVITIQSTTGQYLAVEGLRGVVAGLVISVATGMICILGSYTFIPQHKLYGACLALLVSYTAALVLVVLAETWLLRRGERVENPAGTFESSDIAETFDESSANLPPP